jgi:hypothetical protein
MCGSSSSEKQLGAQEQSFSSTLQSNYAKNFGAQSADLSALNNIFTPIAEAGPDQQGFGPQELAAMNTTAGEGVGQNYAKATQSLNAGLAARGGGNEVLPSGAETQLKAGLASAGANQMSQEQLGITKANYDQGRANFGNATAGLNALAEEYNPNQIASSANNANQSAFGEADKINQQNNQWQSDIAGLATGGIKAGLGFLTGGISNVLSGGSQAGSTTGGGAEQFFSGGVDALKG